MLRKKPMSKWFVALLFGVFFAFSIGCSTAAAADDLQPAPTRVYGMTPGRLWATIDAVAGLVSAILAGWSLARSGRTGKGGRNGAIVAMVVALIVIAYAVLHLNMFTGNFGTGGGRAGAIVAIVMGFTSMVLAGIALTRSHRTG
jgi:Family of unknown function (DUF6223)